MSVVQQYTFWSCTINNPDENDMLIVRNPNDRYVRQVVWTNEVGAEGTAHVQMWIRLYRNNSLSLVKRLYPRGHFKGISRDEYNENCHAYAQKNDDTTNGSHVLTNSEGSPDAVGVLLKVIDRMWTHAYPFPVECMWWDMIWKREVVSKYGAFHVNRVSAEDWLVSSSPYLAKIISSSGYKQVVDRFVRVLWDSRVHKTLCEKSADNKTTQHASRPPPISSRSSSITQDADSYEEVPSPTPSQEDCPSSDWSEDSS